MTHIHFAHAQYLIALLAVLPTVSAFWYANYWLRARARRHYGEEQLVDRYTRKTSLLAEAIELSAWCLCLALVVVAAAGPMLPDAPQRAKAGTLEVVAVMDVSKSMHAEDYRAVMPGPGGSDGTTVLGPHGSRLDMAKFVIEQRIMPAIAGNQLGVVTYSGGGFQQAPLTQDFTAVSWVLDNWVTVTQPAAPGGGSYMADGLTVALETFKAADPKSAGKQRVIVLFTDGGFEGNRADLQKVLAQIADEKIRVIIVGLGGTTPITIPEYTQAADGSYQFSSWARLDGKIATTAYDPSVLQSIQTATGAELIHLQSPSDLNVSWASALAGGKTEAHEAPVFQYPLAVAMLLIVALSLRGLLRRNDLV